MNKFFKRLKESERFQQFKKRIKSLIWRVLDMALVFFTAFMVEELTTIEVAGAWKIAAGLLAGELTKWLNAHQVKYEVEDLEDK